MMSGFENNLTVVRLECRKILRGVPGCLERYDLNVSRLVYVQQWINANVRVSESFIENEWVELRVI